MNTQTQEVLIIDILIAIAAIKENSAHFSLNNEQLLINSAPVPSCRSWPEPIKQIRSNYFIEKVGLIGISLSQLSSIWIEALQKQALSGNQLKRLAIDALAPTQQSNSILDKWQRKLKVRLKEKIQHLEIPPTTPLLSTWPERLLNHPDWACAEPPLPEIPPLPIDEVWVDLSITEPTKESNAEEGLLPQAIEQRYKESQWLKQPADFVLEGLTGTMMLVGAPGIGKTTLLKWVARRLIKKPDGRFLLPLFVPLRAYSLAKAHRPTIDIISYALEFCGIQGQDQIEEWTTTLSYLSGTSHNTVLFLLDGWDEVAPELRELLTGEIQRLGYGFSIIITSRPSAYPRGLGADQFYEISDLPPENITKLALRWHDLMLKPKQADRLLEHLSKHPDLLKLARNPFLLNLLCAINLNKDLKQHSLPRNRTELYTQTLNHIYHYHNNKYPATPFNRQKIEQTQHLALWLLAEAPSRPQYIFGSQEVEYATGSKTLLPSVLNPSRLLSQWHVNSESLYFLHTTFQEYLAAEALLLQPSDKRLTLLQTEQYNPAWQEVFRFIAGKTRHKDHDFWQMIRQIANKPDLFGLIHIRLAYLIAETTHLDGGKQLLGYDLREPLWQSIKTGIASDYYIQAYLALDTEGYISRINHPHKKRSRALESRLTRSLGKISSQQSSQALVDRILSSDKKDAAVACYAVNNVLSAENLQYLRRAIKHEKYPKDTQKLIIRALGNSQDYASIAHLEQLYKQNNSLKPEIINALGNIGGQSVATLLESIFLTTQSASRKIQVINALGRAFDLEARDALIKILAITPPNDPLVETILEALCEIPLARHSELISHFLDFSFPESIRINAMWALMKATEPSITEKLATLGEHDSSEKIRITALATLKNRARSFDFSWLSHRVKDEKFSSTERANALEAIFNLYQRSTQGQIGINIDHNTLHNQTLQLVKICLGDASTDINITAATGAYILGQEAGPTLLKVCSEDTLFADAAREAACQSLGKIKYSPALNLFKSWIKKAPKVSDDEAEATIDSKQRLARTAAQAYIQTDLIAALKHDSQTICNTAREFALEKGYLIFKDKIISPAGKVLTKQTKHPLAQWQLDTNVPAFEQQEALRVICQYLLDSKQACQTSAYPNNPPFALFQTSSCTFTNGINRKTGRKLLNNKNISYQSASMLMKRLQDKFKTILEYQDHLHY